MSRRCERVRDRCERVETSFWSVLEVHKVADDVIAARQIPRGRVGAETPRALCGADDKRSTDRFAFRDPALCFRDHPRPSLISTLVFRTRSVEIGLCFAHREFETSDFVERNHAQSMGRIESAFQKFYRTRFGVRLARSMNQRPPCGCAAILPDAIRLRMPD